MLKIEFQEPTTQEWRNWKTKCARKRRLLIKQFENGQALKIDTKLYKEQKDQVYVNRSGPFSGLCAFCGVGLSPGQPGDIEHFRPKKRIDSLKTGKPIEVVIEDRKSVV